MHTALGALAALEQLPDALQGQPLPGEEEPDETNRIYWGWSGLGRQPPGSARAS